MLTGDLQIKEGISDKQINQLIEYSRTDPQIQKFTSDHTRFKDRKSFSKWHEKGRRIFTLTNQEGNLLGICWVGEKSLPNVDYQKVFDTKRYGTTLAVRTYGQGRGKGLAVVLIEHTLRFYQPKDGVWLQTAFENLSARKLYQSLGFEEVFVDDSKVIAVKPLAKV